MSRDFSIPPFIDGIDRNINYRELTIGQADTLWFVKWDNVSPFAMVKIALEEITDLTEKEFKIITLQEAITLLFYYRLKLYSNEPIDGLGNLPKDYTKRLDNSLTDKKTTIEINKQLFTPFIPLNRAIEAEKYAIDTNRSHELRYFILGAGYINGSAVDGGLHIINSPKNNELRSELIAYNESIKQVSNINLSVYNGVGTYEDKKPDDIRIKLLSTPKGGNEPIVALNFQEVFFLLLNAY